MNIAVSIAPMPGRDGLYVLCLSSEDNYVPIRIQTHAEMSGFANLSSANNVTDLEQLLDAIQVAKNALTQGVHNGTEKE